MTRPSLVAAQKALFRACTILEPDDWNGQRAVLVELDRTGWEHVCNLAIEHGFAGLVARSLEWAKQQFQIDIPVLDRLANAQRGMLMQLMSRRGAARQAGLALAARNIKFVIYKGAVQSEEIYGDLSLRAFRDCDILVPADQFEAAYGVLRDELGYALLQHERVEDFLPQNNSSPGAANAANLRHPRGFSIDLHWSIASHELLPKDLDLIWRYCQPPEKPDALPGLRLSPELTLINCAVHLYSHGYQDLKPLVDFYVTAVKWEKRIDEGKLHTIARAMNMSPMVDLAARLCRRRLAGAPLIERLSAAPPTLRARLACARLTENELLRTARLGPVRLRLRRLFYCGTLASSLRGLRIMLVPSTSDLAQRFRRPFSPVMYPQYYLMQLYRLLAGSKKTFAALLAPPPEKPRRAQDEKIAAD